MNRYIKLYENFRLIENQSPLFNVRKTKEVEPAIKEIIFKENADLIGVYDVIYKFELDGEIKQIEGEIEPNKIYNADNYEFQYSYFTDSRTEEYYDEYWEEIEDCILDEFYAKGYGY